MALPIPVYIVFGFVALAIIVYLLTCVSSCYHSEKQWLKRAKKLHAIADARARELGLLTNQEVFAHDLNATAKSVADPRSLAQRAEQVSDMQIRDLMSHPSDLGELGRRKKVRQDAMKFRPQNSFMAHKEAQSAGLTRQIDKKESRTGFTIKKEEIANWEIEEVVIGCGNMNLEACLSSMADAPAPQSPQSQGMVPGVPITAQTLGRTFESHEAASHPNAPSSSSQEPLESNNPNFTGGSKSQAQGDEVAIGVAPGSAPGASFQAAYTRPDTSLPPVMGVRLVRKNMPSLPLVQRWRFRRVPDEEVGETAPLVAKEGSKAPNDNVGWWYIHSVAFPSMVLAAPENKKAKERVRLIRWEAGAESQMFTYDQGRILCKACKPLAVWHEGDVTAISRSTYGAWGLPVIMVTKRAEAIKSKAKVQADISRLLKWYILKESNCLVVVPRLLRTCLVHSPYFRVAGEEARVRETARGAERPFTGELGRRLIAYSPVFPYILGAAHGDWGEDRFWGLCQLLGCPLVDRTGTLGCPLKLKVLHPIPPKRPDFNSSLEEIMDQRARQLLTRYPGRFQVLWSGGIDTTAVVVAFLRVATEADRSRITIRHCERSYDEYPEFFDRFIKNSFKCKEIEAHVRDAFEPGLPTITGDPADMLMGTHLMARAFGNWWDETKTHANPLFFALEAPWQNTIPKLMRARGLLKPELSVDQFRKSFASAPAYSKKAQALKKEEQEWVQWMMPFVNQSPVPVVSTYDWLWWVTYACKYQHDLMRVFYNRQEISQELVQSVVPFYESEEFHQWSFANHSKKMPDKLVWSSYKMPQKDYILKHTGDKKYWAAKAKVASVRNSWGYELAIDENWNVIRFGEFSISLRRMHEKYGDRLRQFIEPPVLQVVDQRESEGIDPLLLGCGGVAAMAGIFSLAAFMHMDLIDPFSGELKMSTDGVYRGGEGGGGGGGE